jgi:GT2 family glycosyltransferase
MQNNIGVVIPTLGVRSEMLVDCLKAVRDSGAHFVLVVSPTELEPQIKNLADKVILDPGLGLAEAINFGMNELPSDISYVTWIGDDDLFEKNGLKVLARELDQQPKLVLVYGKCTYISSLGGHLGVNQIGQFATKILRFGPDLIPQPSSLFRLDDFKLVKGLNSNYKNAFDFDLFLKLSKLGKVKYVPEMISYFRWHDDSLSVNHRWRSVLEASRVRRSHLHPTVKNLAFLWEPIVIFLTYFSGKLISFRSKLNLTSR